MHKDIKQKWIDSLRSGNYFQCNGALRIKDKGYCCLGVLVDIYAKEKGLPWIAVNGIENLLTIIDNRRYAVLPSEVAKWAGLFYRNPFIKMENSLHSASELNDVKKLDFNQIAMALEMDNGI